MSDISYKLLLNCCSMFWCTAYFKICKWKKTDGSLQRFDVCGICSCFWMWVGIFIVHFHREEINTVFPSCRFWLGRRYGDIVKHFIFPPYLSNRQDDVKFLENHPFSNFKNSPATNHHTGHSAASPEWDSNYCIAAGYTLRVRLWVCRRGLQMTVF